MPSLDVHLQKRSLEGPEDACGDAGVIVQTENDCFLCLIDVLGHGKEAHQVANMAEDFLQDHHSQHLIDLMNGLHAHLRGTRGAVASLCRFDLSNGELRFVGIGNISTRVYGTKGTRFVSRDGIIGYNISTPKEYKVYLNDGDVLILTSDGVREHFDIDLYPGILKGSAREICFKFMDEFSKGNDDASCMVARYLHD